MAVDTATKRSSVQTYSFGGTLPVPDGTIAEGDRAHVAWDYSGLDYDTPVAPAPTTPIGVGNMWLGHFPFLREF